MAGPNDMSGEVPPDRLSDIRPLETATKALLRIPSGESILGGQSCTDLRYTCCHAILPQSRPSTAHQKPSRDPPRTFRFRPVQAITINSVLLHAESFAGPEVTFVRNLSINGGYTPVTPMICPLADTTRRKACDCPDGLGRT
jgi:hypothetical protein